MTYLLAVAEQFNQLNSKQFELAADLILEIKGKGLVFCVGAGGSSATMSHFTSDLLNLGFHSECLTDNVARLTATINDHGWSTVYRTQLKGLITKDDLLVVASVNGSKGISGSGENWSSNLLDVVNFFKENGAKVLSIVGNNGGNLEEVSDQCICISSKDPFVVEGVHSMITHGICNAVKWRMNR